MKKSKLLLLGFLTGIVFWNFFSPGVRVSYDFSYLSKDSLDSWFSVPYIWQERGAEGLGEYTLAVLWGWPKDFILGLGSRLGLSFSVLEKLVVGLPIFLFGYIGIKKLLEDLKISEWGVFLGTLTFLINSYMILLIDGGQLSIALAYAFIPIAYCGVVRSINSGLREKVVAGVLVAICGYLDIRFLYILLVLCFVKFIFDLIVEKRGVISEIGAWLKSGIVIVAIFIGLHFYWILPALLVKAPSLPATYSRSSQIVTLSFANLGHAMSLLSPHWYRNVFGKVIALQSEFVLLVVVVFIAPVIKRKDKNVGFWLLVFLASVFIVKGANDPLPNVNLWMFKNIPGFSLFRDPTKFYVLIALAYSVFTGITCDFLMDKYRSLSKFIPILFSAYILVIVSPAYLGKMTGTLSDPIYESDYRQVTDYFEKDTGFSRVLWLPSIPPMGYFSSTHPALEATRVYKKRPFAAGVVGTYEVFNFLREAPFMGELFDVSGIGYITYPYPDNRREELKQDNIDYYHMFNDQIGRLSWIDDDLIHDFPVPTYKTRRNSERFFITPNTIYIVGSDRIYLDLIDMSDFNLSSSALVFAEEQVGNGEKLKHISHAKILLYKKDISDLKTSLVNKDLYIFPAKQIDFEPKEPSMWWKREAVDLVWWRNFLHEKYGIDNLDFDYGGGWAISEGVGELRVASSVLKRGGVLIARVMRSSRGGRLKFYQGDRKIGEISTVVEGSETVDLKLTGYGDIEDRVFTYDNAEFSWIEVGELVNNFQELVIRTEGDINVVNAMIAISKDEWSRVESEVGGLVASGKVFVWDNLRDYEKDSLFGTESKVKISYKRHSPIHYGVKIENVNEPVTLAYSEAYDSLWQISRAGSDNVRFSYPLYSLINGFMIEEDGEYDIYFSAQKYIMPGLVISGISLIVVSAFLVKSSSKKKD